MQVTGRRNKNLGRGGPDDDGPFRRRGGQHGRVTGRGNALREEHHGAVIRVAGLMVAMDGVVQLGVGGQQGQQQHERDAAHRKQAADDFG